MTTFKSYVAEAANEHARATEFTKAYENAFEQPTIVEEKLHPGELVVGEAKNVIKYSIHDGPSKGTKGTLFCTNFRIMFVSNDTPTYDLIQTRNLLFGEDDILLNSMDAIFVEYPNKKKRIYPASKIRDGIQKLEIHCKDFRVAAFNFKLSLKGEEKGVIKTILKYSYPTLVSLLFAFYYKHTVLPSSVCPIPLYRCREDWREYLNQFDKSDEYWRITSVNENYTLADSMNSYFIVPSSMTDTELKEAAPLFVNNRLPSFCWLSDTGCSLTRQSEFRPEVEMSEWKRRVHNKIRQADSQHRHFQVIECEKICPNQVQQSYIKLKQMCKSGSEQDYLEVDGHWMSSLQSSKWIHHISYLLHTANNAAELLITKQLNVIVRESSGYDISPVLTSLIQIIVDPLCRTRHGFEALIQREWVVAGHPFLDRMGHIVQPLKSKPYNAVINSEGEVPGTVSPIFLLFLDCVWQLTVQYPSSFEFSSFYLTSLNDATHLTLFDTFIFNNERQRTRKIKTAENLDSEETLPIWAWSLQYSDLTMFNNPLYRMKLSGLYEEYPRVIPENNIEINSVSKSLSASCYSLDNLADDSVIPSSQSFAASSTVKKHGRTSSDVGYVDNVTPGVHYNSRTGDLSAEGSGAEGERKRRWFSIRKKKKKNGEEEEENEADSPCFYRTMISDLIKRDSANVKFSDVKVLSPNCSVPSLKFWAGCYLRWNHWSQLLGGRPFSEYHQLSILYDHIYSLNSKIAELRLKLDDQDPVPDNNGSGMYFNHNSSTTSAPDSSENPIVVTSYYPYSPVREANKETKILGSRGRPLLKGGFIYNVGNSRPPHNLGKHVRTLSDFSVTSPSVNNNIDEPSTVGGVSSTSSNSLDNLSDDDVTKGSGGRGHRPKTALMPPKERITYISAV